jgi:uncharacterized lipoprotein YddW (UPF0748 family)
LAALPPALPRRSVARSLLALLAAAAGLASACGEAEPPPEEPAPAAAEPVYRRGLWVLCQGSQRALDDPAKIPLLLEDARALGATDLFVQVYRGGRAWYDAKLADATPYWKATEAAGDDVLRRLVAAAHAEGLRVHAWVNVLNLASNRQAPIVQDLGRDAVLVDQRGRSLLDYPELDVPPPDRSFYRLGTPGVWLDPGSPGVAERLTETFTELVTRYPELDGLHLDYIRYPGVLPFAPGSRFGVGLDMGHGEPTRARFRQETGLAPPSPPRRLANANRWDDWRRDKVTELVRWIGEATRSARPELLLSAAVWSHADRAYLSVGQDWRSWLDDGLLDFAVPMTYTLDETIFRHQSEDFARASRGDRTWIGTGVWLFAKRPAEAVAQLRTARKAGAVGDVLFSWDAIADAPALRDALAAEHARVQAEAAAEPPSDE